MVTTPVLKGPERERLLATAFGSGTVLNTSNWMARDHRHRKCLPKLIPSPFFAQVVGDHGGTGFHKLLFQFGEGVGKIAFDIELSHKLLFH